MVMIDVIISTRDNVTSKHFSLYYVIRSLLHQSQQDLNIIVADNGSKDDTTVALRKAFGQKVGVLDTSDVAGNLAASRNRAVSCGKAELVMFLDDDMIPNGADTLEKSFSLARKVDFACGARRLWAPLSWSKLIRPDDPINKALSTLRHTAFEPHSVNRISGKNILDNRSYLANYGTISRRVFEEVGGFDEEYVGWGYQDTDLMRRLCVAGYSYDLFSHAMIEVFHLSHPVDKGQLYEVNRRRFVDKQREDGRAFNTNHFFEIYENDGYSLFSDFREPV